MGKVKGNRNDIKEIMIMTIKEQAERRLESLKTLFIATINDLKAFRHVFEGSGKIDENRSYPVDFTHYDETLKILSDTLEYPTDKYCLLKKVEFVERNLFSAIKAIGKFEYDGLDGGNNERYMMSFVYGEDDKTWKNITYRMISAWKKKIWEQEK